MKAVKLREKENPHWKIQPRGWTNDEENLRYNEWESGETASGGFGRDG
jgi:hypothetical protein